MKLEEAYIFFKSLKTEATRKSEIRIYKKFLYILNELKSKEFTKDEIQSIEDELETFNLKSNSLQDINFFKKALSKFEKFLKETFSLTSKGHYTSLGIGLGSSFGILFGIVFLSSLERSMGIALGLGIGMLIGLLLGRTMDSKAINEGRVL